MARFVATCSSDPGLDGECPTGSLVWAPEQDFSALPELTPGEIGELSAAFLVMFAAAVGIRFIIKQLVK